MSFAYYLEAYSDCSSDFAPVHTIFPLLKISAVVFGSLILIIAAANLLGLNSQFLHFEAISKRLSSHCKFAVETIFCNFGLSKSGLYY